MGFSLELESELGEGKTLTGPQHNMGLMIQKIPE